MTVSVSTLNLVVFEKLKIVLVCSVEILRWFLIVFTVYIFKHKITIN